MKSKRVLVLGGTGMLGHKLVQMFSERFNSFYTIRGSASKLERYGIFDRNKVIENVDALNFDSVRSAIESTKPDVVINAIGIIKQLPSSKDVVQTLSINSILPHLVAKLAEELDFRFISVSTDCVFSGTKGNYTEGDLPDACDLYGRSKQLGEVTTANCLTLRTSIIGREIRTDHSLIDWFLSETGRVKGYTEAIFSGFPTIVLAELIADLVATRPALEALYHVSSDPISKFNLLMLVKQRLGLNIQIEQFSDIRIDRSLDSTRFQSKTGFKPSPWSEMVDRMFSDPTPYDDLRKVR